MGRKIVVVGGSAAGMAAAAKAKRVDPNADIIVFERSRYVSYAPCGIPYYIEGLVDDIARLVYYDINYFREKRGLDIRNRHLVTDIDSGNRVVTAIDLDKDREVKVEYDRLMIATGGEPIIPPIENVDLDGIHTVRLLEDGESLYRSLRHVRRVGIVGGGYIGLELAEAFKRRGKEVYLFEMLDHVMPTFDKEAAKPIEDELTRNDVELHLNERVIGFEGDGRVRKIVTEKGSYNIDLVLLAVGVRPNIALAEMLGLKIGETGAISVDSRMMTSHEDIYAAGDNVETLHLVTKRKTYIPLAPAANKMGRVAGENMAGGYAEFPGVVGTSITKVFDLQIGKTGLSLHEALKSGFDAVAVDIVHGSISHYYPGFTKINIRLVADRETHRILGGEITGYDGVLARIDTLATAITAGMTTEDLKMLDLAYAPPFAPVWDGLIVAATVIEKKF
jgi:NADPH-dependent 2,4-dienoyl-CoA reductase/sulfur reductase-like enzyme